MWEAGWPLSDDELPTRAVPGLSPESAARAVRGLAFYNEGPVRHP